MTRTILPGLRTGVIRIPASKSQAHRMLICAALSASPSHLIWTASARILKRRCSVWKRLAHDAKKFRTDFLFHRSAFAQRRRG